jgi:hypothetical protein
MLRLFRWLLQSCSKTLQNQPTRPNVWATIMKPSENPIQMHTQERSRLPDTLPSFAAELQQLLKERSEPELAAQVRQLTIFDRRRCGDDFCATFYAL